MSQETLRGLVFYGPELEPTPLELLIENGVIVDTEEYTGAIDTFILPFFVNVHIHLGDSVAKDPTITSLDDLFRPPGGFKHRVLQDTPADRLTESMRGSLNDAVRCGTGVLADFREGGAEGIGLLRDAVEDGHPRVMVLGRPIQPDLSDLQDVIEAADGVGLSGANDMPSSVLEEIAEDVRSAGKFLAIHAGEKDDSDIEVALALDPDLLVHMTHANSGHLREAADRGIPVAVCPRSNLLLGVGRAPDLPPVRRMLDLGVRVCVGTDNVMLNSPNMFAEMEFLRKAYGVSDHEALRICTLEGAKALKMDSVIGTVEISKIAGLTILDACSDNLCRGNDPIALVVRRARPDDVRAVRPIGQ